VTGAVQVSAATASTPTVITPARALPPPPSVTITAVGDTMLGNSPALPSSPASYFAAVARPLRRGAQIVFANLEGTLSDAGTSKCQSVHHNCYAFRAPPSFARALRAAGFTVLNDANNHSYDFGAPGQAQTVAALHAAGLAQTGLPGEVTLLRVRGVRVAMAAFAPYDYTANLLDRVAAQRLIRQARRRARVVVVYLHAGAEGVAATHVTGADETYLGEDRGNPEAFAHMAIDAGASLVIASGPHVLRGMQVYRHHLIAYSLGNFAGYGNFATGGVLSTSVILRVTLAGDGSFVAARLVAVQLVGAGRPVLGGGAVAMIGGLSRADFGRSAARVSSTGRVTLGS
jgi:hypothetical protein